MARAIIKNPVGTNSGWEDVKILIAKAYQQNYMIYTLTCSYEGVNYEVTFRIMNGQFTVLSEQGDDMTGKRLELINLIEDMDSIKAILYMVETFYNLDLISEYDLLFQSRDLEEVVEAYLNGGIKAGEIDELGYWKTLLSKDGNQYTVGDKDSGNNISIFKKGDEIWFGVDGAEVKNDGLSIINKDVYENVFSQATANGVCYLPMTWYEELLEFLGTKLSAFENDSWFVEKEFNKKRWYNADFTDGTLNAYYDGIKYSAYQDGEIEQGVPNIEVEYEEGGSEIIANIMKGKVQPLYGVLVDTEYAFIEAEDDGLTEYFSKEKLDELSLYVLNNSYEDVMKLYNDGGLIGYKEEYVEDLDEPISERDYELTELLTGDDERVKFRFRKADRYGYYCEEMNQDLFLLFDMAFLLPLELYQEIIGYNYERIPATGIAINDSGIEELTIGEEPVSFSANVLPTTDGTGGTISYATNNTIARIQSGEGRVAISKDEYDEPTRLISGATAGEVTLTGVTADGGFSESVNLTVYPQMYNITLSHIDGPGSPMEVEEGTAISTDGDTIYIGDLTGTANVEQGFVFDYFTATIDGETITLIDGEDITVESDMTLTAISHENVSSDITLTLASNPSGHTTFMDMNQQTISSVTIPAGSTIYISGNQVILGALEDQDTETIVDADVQMPYGPDHRELDGVTLEDFTDYTVQTSGILTLVVS